MLEHRELMAALMARDVLRAEQAMHTHLMAQLSALKALQAAESGHAHG